MTLIPSPLHCYHCYCIVTIALALFTIAIALLPLPLHKEHRSSCCRKSQQDIPRSLLQSLLQTFEDAELLLLLTSCTLLTFSVSFHVPCCEHLPAPICKESALQTLVMHCMKGVWHSRTLAALKLQSELKHCGLVPLQPSTHLSQCFSL